MISRKQLGRMATGLCVGLVLGLRIVTAQERNEAPVIKHDPVTTAVKGQPITILATVTDDSGMVKSVTLFYSLSKDAAPFRVPMKTSGGGAYFGSIPSDVMANAKSVSYYIEALDYLDTMQETKWHTASVREPAAKPVEAARSPDAATPVVRERTPAPPQQEKSNLLGIGLIAGGAAAVIGAAVLVAQNGGGGGDDGGGDAGDVAGTYSGNVTECFTLSGGSPSCSSHPMSIVIGEDGSVTSDSLSENGNLSGTLNGRDFLLVATVDGPQGTGGEILYSGTVVDNRIAGTISGSATTVDGAGVYSGAFSGSR